MTWYDMQGVSTKDLAHQQWNTFSKHWRGYNETNSQSNTIRVHLNQVFANRSEDDEISSQHAKVDLKSLIVSVIPIYSFSDTINLFRFLFFI